MIKSRIRSFWLKACSSEYGKGSSFSIILEAQKKGFSFKTMNGKKNLIENEISQKIYKNTRLKQLGSERIFEEKKTNQKN